MMQVIKPGIPGTTEVTLTPTIATSSTLAVDSGLPSPVELRTMMELAETLVKSGLLPAHIKTPQAALAVIQKGRELRIAPMYALSNIVVIQGKPTANAELMLALIYRDHGDGAIHFAETTSEACVIEYRRRAWPQARRHAFTLADARLAGLLSNQTWQKYPAAMLRARCISAVARLAFPDSIGGMYTAEELGAAVEVRAEGEVVVAAETEEYLPVATSAELDEVLKELYLDAGKSPEEWDAYFARNVSYWSEEKKRSQIDLWVRTLAKRQEAAAARREPSDLLVLRQIVAGLEAAGVSTLQWQERLARLCHSKTDLDALNAEELAKAVFSLQTWLEEEQAREGPKF